MDCQPDAHSVTDRLQILKDRRSSDTSAKAWLVQQGIRSLHGADKEGDFSYKHIIELLSRIEAGDSIVQLIRTAPQADIPLRWSLLYLLGEIADKRAAKWLAQFSVEALPAKGEGCEGPRDTELLLRTMAIESLKNIAVRHREASDYLLKIISDHPDRAVLIEAVKAAVELGFKEKIAGILPKEDHWILEIRKATMASLQADPERTDTNERSFTPPKMMSDYTSPSIKYCCRKGE
jgi:hypothetical protein